MGHDYSPFSARTSSRNTPSCVEVGRAPHSRSTPLRVYGAERECGKLYIEDLGIMEMEQKMETI